MFENIRSSLRRIGVAVTVLVMFAVGLPVVAAYSRVITFGADLNRAQRAAVASQFGINLAETDVPVVDITNAEERKYLGDLVPGNVIGSRAISSALVEILPEGQGIRVETRNINWVTADMYANALVTAGVRDAKVMVAAPYPVSGTAALTGIIKAFEVATGKYLGDRSKRVANEELVQTGNLGREIGKDKATKLILLVKERVITERAKDPDQIRQIIINVAGELNINLSERQIEDILALMQKISALNLNAGDLVKQLTNLRTEVERMAEKQPELRSWLERFLEAIGRLVQHIRALILGEG